MRKALDELIAYWGEHLGEAIAKGLVKDREAEKKEERGFSDPVGHFRLSVVDGVEKTISGRIYIGGRTFAIAIRPLDTSVDEFTGFIDGCRVVFHTKEEE